MQNKSITDYANDAVKQLATLQPHFELLKNVTFEVQIEDDELAIINFEGDDLFIEVELREVPTLSIRRVVAPVYIAGYYKHHSGGMWNPPEVEDVRMRECKRLTEAVSELVKLDFFQRAEDILEAESYAEVEDIFEEIA